MPPTLPIECLVHIIENIAQEWDIATLGALIRVSKEFHWVTMPFLYGDPLQLLEHSVPNETRHKRTEKLLRMLLLSSPAGSPWSELLVARFDLSEAEVVQERVKRSGTGTGTGTGNGSESGSGGIMTDKKRYQACLRHFQTFSSSREVSMIAIPSVALYFENTRFASFVRETRTDGGLFTKHEYPIESNLYQDPEPKDLPYLNQILQKEIIWLVCSPILEQIQSLSIPLSDLERYQQSVDRLKSLRSVTFLLDERVEPSHFVMAWLELTSPETNEKIRQKKENLLMAMVHFVQTHRRLHKNILTLVSCPTNKSFFGHPQTCPDDILKLLELD
ncbi:hypothetical protein BGZ94_008817 [Podila epigama]|nr:hypothetical protein BGZ94_008817 [Podila epigama]